MMKKKNTMTDSARYANLMRAVEYSRAENLPNLVAYTQKQLSYAYCCRMWALPKLDPVMLWVDLAGLEPCQAAIDAYRNIRNWTWAGWWIAIASKLKVLSQHLVIQVLFAKMEGYGCDPHYVKFDLRQDSVVQGTGALRQPTVTTIKGVDLRHETDAYDRVTETDAYDRVTAGQFVRQCASPAAAEESEIDIFAELNSFFSGNFAPMNPSKSR
jgi:hypothetical protein